MMWRKMIRGLMGATDLILPRICISCGEKLLIDEKHMCMHCLADMPRTFFWTARHNPMADRLNSLIQSELESKAGQISSEWQREPYAYAVALFHYDGTSGYSSITRELKYQGNIGAGRYFSKMLGNRIRSCGWMNDIDLIVPVPLHSQRLRKRGYNQAEIIASEIATCLGVPMYGDFLVRTRKTASQATLEVEQKSANVSGAFQINPKAASNAAETFARSGRRIRHILITDDVFTTGATAFACFQALREHLPPDVRISIATLGFVGRA